MNFVKGFSISSFTSVIVLIVGFINNIIVTRYLGPEGRGIYAVLSNFVMLALLLLGEGIRRRNTLLTGDDSEKKDAVFTHSLLLVAIYLIVLFITAVQSEFFYSFMGNVPSLYIAITSITIILMISWQSIQAIFLGLEKIYWFNLIVIIAPLVVLLINLFGIFILDFQLKGILISQSIASFIALSVGLFILKPKIELIGLKKLNSDKLNRSIMIKSTISSVSFFIAYRSPIFFINYFLGPVQAGLYSIINTFIDLLQKIPNEAGAILISKTAQKGETNSSYYTTRLVRIFMFINLFVVLFFYLLGKKIIIILFGDSFSDAFLALLWSLPALQFYSVGLILNAYYMGKKYPKFMMANNFIFAISTAILFYIFLPGSDIYNAAKISSALVVFWTFNFLFYFKRNEKINFMDLVIIKLEDFRLLFSIFGKLKSAIRK